MENGPQFVTAIPKRRYRIGEFNAVVLGDIESKDNKTYVYVFAMVKEGESDPVLYVALERPEVGKYRMVVTVEGQCKSFDAGAAMADIDHFSEGAIDAAVQLFKLQDEEPYRMM